MAYQEDVSRVYNVLPAIEQTKLIILEKLNILFTNINVLFSNKFQSKKDEDVISAVKSTSITLYLMLKPKIIEYIRQKEKIGASDVVSQELSRMIQKIESSLTNPSTMSIEDAIYYADVLNIFCHEYGVTKITYFAGTVTSQEKDIYKVST